MLKTTGTSYINLYIESAVLILMAIGTVFVFSAGANISSNYDLSQFYNFTTLKQLLFFPLAIVVMYTFSLIDYHQFGFAGLKRFGLLRSITTYMLILAIILLVLVLIPKIGVEKNYSRRWLSISIGSASLSFQPSELAKWTLVFFLAAYLDKNYYGMRLYFKKFIPPCIVIGLVVGLIVTQDFGTAALIALLSFLMLVIGNAVWWHFLTPLPVLFPVLYFAIASSPTRINRLKAFFEPSNLSNPATFQVRQSLIAISTGGIWGKGLGKGISKYGHLPEDTTDFIFAIIAEELGFAGAGLVIALFMVLTLAGIILIRKCQDRFGKLLASGIVLTISIQAAINIGVVTDLLPTTGMPLPLISAGGSGMLLSAAAVGVLLNIAKQTSGQPLDLEVFRI